MLAWACAPKVVEAPLEAPVGPPRSDLMYLLMVDRFADGNEWNNGSFDRQDPQAFHGGDLAGVTQHLDHLDELGVGTVWLTPIFDMREEPFHGWGAFHGYWTWNFDQISPRFGTTEEAIALADGLHRRGMRLVLDMVYNHVGMEAALLEEHPDWFHPDQTIEDWQDPVQVRDGWVHGLPDLDQDNPDVRAWLTERTIHWVRTLNADGLRIDAVRHMPPDFVRDMVRDVEAELGRELWIVGEDFSGDPAVLAATLEETEVDAVYDFPLRYALTDVFCKNAPVGRLGSTLSLDRLYTDPNTQLVGFLDNHDLPRIASECAGEGYGPVELHQALAVLLSARGTPSISWGTELPILGAEEPENRVDYDWDLEPQLFGTIEEFAEARRVRASLREGRDWIFHLGGEDVLGYARVTPDEAAVVVINRSPAQVTVHLPDRLRMGDSQETFHEVVGDEGPFLRHSQVPELPAGESHRVRPYTLFGDSVMVGYLRPDVSGGYGALVDWIETQSARRVPLVVEVLSPVARVEGAPTVQLPPGDGPLVMVGAGPELGHWDPSRGVILLADGGGGLRSAPVELPPWTVAEYKLVRLNADGEAWEEGGNHHVLLGDGGAFEQLAPVVGP